MLLTLDRNSMVRQLTGVNVSIFLDGKDVTNDAFMADDAQGYVGVYIRDGNGRRQLNAARTMMRAEVKTGEVIFVWRKGDITWIQPHEAGGDYARDLFPFTEEW